MYIRTIDNEIYEVDDTQRMCLLPAGSRPGQTGYCANKKFISDSKIVDKSVNLEELCDAVAIFSGSWGFSEKPFIYNYYGNLNKLRHILSYNVRYDVKFGVYTHQGLIYVGGLDLNTKEAILYDKKA